MIKRDNFRFELVLARVHSHYTANIISFELKFEFLFNMCRCIYIYTNCIKCVSKWKLKTLNCVYVSRFLPSHYYSVNFNCGKFKCIQISEWKYFGRYTPRIKMPHKAKDKERRMSRSRYILYYFICVLFSILTIMI